MKLKKKFLCLLPLIIQFQLISAQVGINTASPDASAMLEVSSTEKGVLISRMTVTERVAITAPATGLLVYQTNDVDGFYYYNGTKWIRLLDFENDRVPVGAIFAYSASTIPTGYLTCDGSAVSRTTYADLFTLIGETYGAGDGSTTFNLPDYRGQFLRGVDAGATTDPDATSRIDRGDGTTGDAVGTKQFSENLAHDHEVNPPSTATNATGSHSHTTSYQYLTTSSAGNHIHTISGSGSSATTPDRYRTFATRTVGSGSFGSTTIREVSSTLYTANSSHTHGNSSSISSNGTHTHSINIPSSNTNATGDHTHNVDIPSFSSSITTGSESRPTNVSVIWCIKY